MREIRTSGLMSGDGKRAALCAILAPILDSTEMPFLGEAKNVETNLDAAGRNACATVNSQPIGSTVWLVEVAAQRWATDFQRYWRLVGPWGTLSKAPTPAVVKRPTKGSALQYRLN